MADTAGYADDFEEFRRQGEIGLVPALRLHPAEPEIGTRVEVEVRVLRQGRLRCSDGQAWPVQQGTRLHLPVRGRLQFQLLDERGHAVADAIVQPWIERPVLRLWPVPAALDWDAGSWAIPQPQAESVEQVQLHWRLAESAAWQPLAAGERLPVPPRRATLMLRAELRSRHAAWSEDAVVVHERQLQVVPPAPQLLTPLPGLQVVCHQSHVFALRARNVRELQLQLLDCILGQAHGNGQHPLLARTVWQPQACGTWPLRLVGRDLEGQPIVLAEAEVQVRPRDIQVRFVPWSDEADTVRVEVAGARAQALLVPLTGEHVPDLPERFRITLLASGGADLLVQAQDDAGEWTSHALRLDPSPFAWEALPTWGEPPEVRW
jgi:hypothetical protein